ncbi:hypothetical protein D3C76_1285530 [compost metagenome]
MHPGHVLALEMGALDQFDDLFQMQLGAVDHLFGTVAFKDGGWYQGTGVDDHRAVADQSLAFDRDEVRVAGAGADEVHGHDRLLWKVGERRPDEDRS